MAHAYKIVNRFVHLNFSLFFICLCIKHKLKRDTRSSGAKVVRRLVQRAISKVAGFFMEKVRSQLAKDQSKRTEDTTYKIEEEENKASGLDLKFSEFIMRYRFRFYNVSTFNLRVFKCSD